MQRGALTIAAGGQARLRHAGRQRPAERGLAARGGTLGVGRPPLGGLLGLRRRPVHRLCRLRLGLLGLRLRLCDMIAENAITDKQQFTSDPNVLATSLMLTLLVGAPSAVAVRLHAPREAPQKLRGCPRVLFCSSSQPAAAAPALADLACQPFHRRPRDCTALQKVEVIYSQHGQRLIPSLAALARATDLGTGVKLRMLARSAGEVVRSWDHSSRALD